MSKVIEEIWYNTDYGKLFIISRPFRAALESGGEWILIGNL